MGGARWLLGLVAAGGCPAAAPDPADRADDPAVPTEPTLGDCTAGVIYHADTDGDGFGDAAVEELLCDPAPGWVEDASDCDDTKATVHPGALERCGGIDEDCDGLIDDADGDLAGDLEAWPDGDGDGHGDAAVAPRSACVALPGEVIGDGSDCDDTDQMVHPGAIETTCDGVDSDCDPQTPLQLDVPGEISTIQAAIEQATADEPVCVAPGTYYELLTFPAESLGVLSEGGPDVTIIDAQGIDTVAVFPSNFQGGYTPLLQGFTLRGGVAGASTDGEGGGVWIGENAAPILRDVVIEDNQANEGGGIYVAYEGDLILEDASLIANYARDFGGGLSMSSSSSVSLARVLVQDNTTAGDQNTRGAGIQCNGELVVQDSTFLGNREVDTGGGIAADSQCTLTMERTLMQDNAARFEGDALYLWGSTYVRNSTFVANGDPTGSIGYGAINTSAPLLDLANVIVAGNARHGISSSNFTADSTLRIVNTVVVGNGDAGLSLTQDYGQTDLSLHNSIVAYNADGLYVSAGASAAVDVDASYNDVWGNLESTFSGEAVDFTETNGNLSVDPGFVALDLTADPLAWDLTLDPASSLVDAGDPALSDPDGSVSDIGAYGGPAGAAW
jgi:hypothetical protein